MLDTILDSGTTLNFVPTPIANAFSAAFNPPAVYNESQGAYVTLCSAKTPKEFTVKIGGQTFVIDTADQLLPIQTQDDEGRDLCMSGTTDGGPVADGNVFILLVFFFFVLVLNYRLTIDEGEILSFIMWLRRSILRRMRLRLLNGSRIPVALREVCDERLVVLCRL